MPGKSIPETNPGPGFRWSARVRGSEQGAVVYTRNHRFTVGTGLSFREADLDPSAIEYLLGALGGELVTGFAETAHRRAVPFDALELGVNGELENPLIALGVIGESGSSAFGRIEATLYVSSEASLSDLEQIWDETLTRSPIASTLGRAVDLSFSIQRSL